MRCRCLWAWVLAFAAWAHAQTFGLIVYTHAPDGGPPRPMQDIHAIRADGSQPRALTNDGHSHDPSWSPDGKRILFVHDTMLSAPPAYRETENTKSHHPIELSVMDADGRNRRVLRTIETVIYSVAWSPDGKTLAISAGTSLTPGDLIQAGLYLLASNGRGPLRMLIPNGWTPSWSPDGSKLAFSVEYPPGSWTVHTANADGTQDIRLTDPGQISGSPAWSPDGKRIAFDQIAGGSSRQQVFLMNADGSGLRQVTTDARWSCEHPTWSPDGNLIAASCRSAASPCGMRISSTGQPMPECSRRLFLFQTSGGGDRRPRELSQHDGAGPSFAPGRP